MKTWAEILAETPDEIGAFKRKEDQKLWERAYNFTTHSPEEASFVAGLEVGGGGKRLLRYENDQRVYCLYVTADEEGEAEYWMRELTVLDAEESDYEERGEDILEVALVNDAVWDFLKRLRRYEGIKKQKARR